MAIPKMKLYRLDQNYSPDNDTDLKSISDDELYPFVEKVLDLNSFEQLIGVTYRDLMVGKSYSTDSEGNTLVRELNMYSEDDGVSFDTKKTEFVNCDGWKKGRNAVTVKISKDGTSFSEVVPDSYYRINYVTESRMFDAAGSVTTDVTLAISKRQGESLQIEFGNVFFTDNVFLAEGETIVKVRLEYLTFSNDIFSNDTGRMALGRGYIYDGTVEGRLGTASVGGYGYKSDSDGLPLKAEGNIGYKAKFYPCRQKVALQDGVNSLWNRDYLISSSGGILIENCQDWILTPTDERRPRLFERVVLNGKTFFQELEQTTQYTTTNIPGNNGNIDLMIQLSAEYYNIAYGVYAYPKELFIRFNEESDILEDVFIPDYLNYDEEGLVKGETGSLTPNISNYNTVSKKIFRMALTTTSGYDSSRDFLLTHGSGAMTIDLGESFEGDIVSSLKLYYHGNVFYNAGNTMVDSLFAVRVSGSVITITPKSADIELPNGILVSYNETHSVGLGKDSEGNNYWACGFRVCCYEKTKSAKEFVSSFRNWVSNHLNNNPDIFWGWQEYQGSQQNTVGISFLSGGYSILYREGAITFSEEMTQVTFQDLKNFPPAGVDVGAGATNAILKKHLKQVYAKFAYYDGIRDITNGLLREFDVNSGVYKYRIIDDPTYPDVEDKRWIIRNDDKMPTTFFHKNTYLPTPNYVETGNCEIYVPINMNEGETLVLNLSDYREVAIKNLVEPPDVIVGGNGDTFEKTFVLVVDVSRIEETKKETGYSGPGVRFTVKTLFEKRSNSWFYKDSFIVKDGVTVLDKLSSREFDPSKTIAEIISERTRYIHLTNEGAPFNVVFEAGENNLLIYAEKK